MSQIVAHHVSKYYDTEVRTRALTEFSISVEHNEFLCIVGPSGCGKSTFLNLVAGFIFPSEGNLIVDGKPVTGPGPDRGVVFQEDALFPWLTALDNVAFGLEMRGMPKSHARERASEILTSVGLSGFERHLPKALSGGMKQRVAISRVLANDPDVMLLDEPFSALDAFTRTSLQNELLRIWERNRRTLIFITHNVEEAVLLGTSVAVMTKGSDGGRLIRQVQIDMGRPRDTTGSKFNEYKRHIYSDLESHPNSEILREEQNETQHPRPTDCHGIGSHCKYRSTAGPVSSTKNGESGMDRRHSLHRYVFNVGRAEGPEGKASNEQVSVVTR